MPDIDQPSLDEMAVDEYAHGANLSVVKRALASHREDILARWLVGTLALACHRGRHERAVADHIPALFDAVVAYLDRNTPSGVDSGMPLDDEAIRAAAQGHALVRADQGLQPRDILTEFRILRKEIGRALRLAVPDRAPTGDVVAAELLLNDALDGANAMALAALTTRLEQVREELLATTVHDVRQPLTSIYGYVQLAERSLNCPSPDPKRIRDSLDHIRQAVEQMTSMLTTLVDVSRTALGALVLEPQLTDLRSIVEETLSRFSPNVAQRIHLDLPNDGTVLGSWDPSRLVQVFSNLLSNAAKYSPDGTPISVTIRRNADHVVAQVRDEGIGIPAEDLPHVFGRYVRAGNAAAGRIEGSGLGLYLSKGIVEAHGGHIWAVSPGQDLGTTVFVELPCGVPATEPVEPAPEQESIPGH